MRTTNHLDSFPPFSSAQLTTQIVIGSVNLIDATAELKFAAAFVSQQDERTPVVLVIGDQKRPVENWIREGSYLFFLTSDFPPAAAFHATLK